jgi:hypothetical protein
MNFDALNSSPLNGSATVPTVSGALTLALLLGGAVIEQDPSVSDAVVMSSTPVYDYITILRDGLSLVDGLASGAHFGITAADVARFSDQVRLLYDLFAAESLSLDDLVAGDPRRVADLIDTLLATDVVSARHEAIALVASGRAFVGSVVWTRGEPPASKGYTPTVFAELPKLLERAGPGRGAGTITGLFTVLVEGDDHNEPISDAVRGILDGHIVLDRDIAERGRYPAINVLRSLSRTVPDCLDDEENALATRARALLSTYENMAELVRLGAYKKGSDPDVDLAVDLWPALENFLRQGKQERDDLESGFRKLAQVLAPAVEGEGA